jgi:hypothetical protein
MLKVDYVFPIFLIFMSVFSNSLSGQQVEWTLEKVYRYCYVVKPTEWYKNQEQLSIT